MRKYIYNHIKYITLAIVSIIAIVLFNMLINTNQLFNNTLKTVNNLIYRDGEVTLDLADPKYYKNETLLGEGKNRINSMNKVEFDLDTSITNQDDLEYVIVYDNTNEDSTFTPDKEYYESTIVKKIDTTLIRDDDNPGIGENIDKYDIHATANDNITIVDEGLIPYQGCGRDHDNKCVGLLVDFGVKVEGTGTYNIDEDPDYVDAARWGATTNTTFVMWLSDEKEGPYTFKNVNDEEDTYELTINFDTPENIVIPHVYLDSEVNITSKFDYTVDLENNITLTYKNDVDYQVGSYKLYVWPIGDQSKLVSKTFELLEPSSFTIADNAVLLTGDGNNKSADNTWNIELTNLVDVDVNDITLTKIYKEENEIKYDYTSYFYLESITVDSEDETRASVVVSSLPVVSDLELEEGTYILVFNYLGVTKTSNITVTKTVETLTEVSSNSYRQNITDVNYEIINYNETSSTIKIKVSDEEKTLTIDEFNRDYRGVTLSDILTDEEGNILYKYSDDIIIKNITVQEEVEYVNYIDGDNNLQQVTKEQFITDNGELDTDKYSFVDDKIYLKVSGTHIGYEDVSNSIRYGEAGKFEFVYDYDTMNSNDFDKMSVKLTHQSDSTISPMEFVIFDYGYNKTKTYTGDDEYKEVTGYEFTPYTNDVDTSANNSFDLSYEVDTTNHTIKFIIIYDNRLPRYCGNYNLDISFIDGKSISKTFSLTEVLSDFYVATYVDKHAGSGDALNEKYPPSNKQYEYYISLRMVKGENDPDRYFDSSNLSVNIYSKRADLDNENNIYFFDQKDYVIKLISYKDDVVIYKYSEEVDKVDSERTYIDEEEILDGTSKLETKYTDVYNSLNNYKYDEEGNIVTDSDNIDKSIIHKTIVDGNEYLTYMNGDEEVTVLSKQYVSVGGNIDTLTDTYRHLEFDSDGNVIRGIVKGSYVTNTYENNDTYEVTSLFDITINEDETDIDRAIKVLPKTEITPGTYYVYVHYNDTLYGVGYVNNTTANKGIYESIDDVVIKQSVYPTLWNRNIHMSYLTYDNPQYSIVVSDSTTSNESDETDNIYYNAVSHIMYRVIPYYIYNYGDITYKLQKQVDGSYADVDSSTYTIRLLDNSEEEIENISNYNGSYYVVVDTTNEFTSGNYRLVIQYTNPNNNISLDEDINLDIDLTNRYYGLTIGEGTDVLEFPHNNSVNKKVVIVGDNITNYDNLAINIYYYDDGVKKQLTQDENGYSYTDDEDTNVYFTLSSEEDENNNYVVTITNVVDVTQIGNYSIEFVYQEGNNTPTTKSIDMYIAQDQYQMNYENEYPRATENELSFAKDFTTHYIDRASLNDISFVVYMLDTNTSNYVDVSSSSVSTADRHVLRHSPETVECEGTTCTGKIRFYLNKNKINYNASYKIVATYSGITTEMSVTKFSEMFDWDVQSTTITSTRTYEENDTIQTEVITGIYKDLSNPQISVVLDSSIHTDNIKWNVNTSCLSTASGTCDPTNGAFSDLFDAINNTGTDGTIVLLPKKDASNNIRIAAGRYSLVLFYDRNDYRVVEFEIHNQYENNVTNITFEYGTPTIVSSLTTSSGVETFDNLYTNLSGTLSIPVTITGIPYSSVSRYVVNSMNNVVNTFEMNSESDFNSNHLIRLTYNYSRGVVPAGTYKIVCEYLDGDNQTVKQEYEFTVQSEYFDLNITDYVSVPTTLYDNQNGSGIFTIQTKNLTNLDKDEFNNTSNGKMHAVLRNSKVYDSSNQDVTSSFTLTVRAHNDISVSNKFDILVSYNANTVPIGEYKFVTSYTLSNNSIERERTFTIVEGPTEIPALSSTEYTVSDHMITVSPPVRVGITKEAFVGKLTNLREGYIIKKGDVDVTNTVEIIGTGMVIINPGEDPYEIIIKGDISGDGVMTPSDYVLVRKHLLGTGTLTGPYLKAADYDSSGGITPSDYVLIRKALMS